MWEVSAKEGVVAFDVRKHAEVVCDGVAEVNGCGYGIEGDYGGNEGGVEGREGLAVGWGVEDS